ncbi:IPT/TIG domain-containing protein [Salinibacterium sp. UTAS2018]|uniref:IPT/TIG domain-containing protein n=1 Tax=Salinibacterium sp. UTAS2018 TaxID=2508880 RepID=UPI00143CF1D1|nr:IPT/TIG domain-containing protein [Salinibacterium sp. UTAS2018]
MTLSVFSAGAPAQAAAGDDSVAESAFLSGDLVASILAADLGHVAVSNDGTLTTQTANSGIGASIDLSALSLPLTLDAGLLRTFAEAENEGSSVAAAGLIDVSGDFSSANPSYTPGSFSLDLTDALSGSEALLTELAELKLDLGALSSRASIDAAGAPVGDYQIVGTQLLLTSNTLAGVVGTVNTAAGLVETEVDALVGPGGAILAEVTDVVDDALSTLNLGSVSASVSLDLVGAVSTVLTDPLTNPLVNGAVTLDLSTGIVAIDLNELNAGGLSNQPANTNILTADQLAAVAASLDTILFDLQTRLNNAVSSTLTAAVLDVAVVLELGSLSVATLTIAGPLGDFASGEAEANIQLLPGLGTITAGIVSPLLNGVLAGVLSGLGGGLTSVSTLLDPAGPVMGGFASTLTSQVVALVSGALELVLDSLPALISLTVNHQEFTGTAPNQKFVETALRVEVLQGVLATLNIAQAAVGPNFAGVRPAITDVDPTSGPVTGGTSVTLTGTDFNGSTGVTFDGTAGTDFTVVSDTEITVTSPAHAAGGVEVIIQHPAGASDDAEFTYTPVPVISSLDPDFGPIAGGTAVTITGSDFTDATAVTFDGTEGTIFTVVSDTQITVTSPAHALGAVDLIIERDSGDSAPETFTYRGAPTVSNMTPVEGPLAGGTAVTITGTGFTGSTGVTFDGADGTSFTVVSDTEITVSSPAHAAETIDVIVVHPIGNADAGEFTYTAAPIISSLSPNIGPIDGGTAVTITGSGFTGSTGVTFDGDDGTLFTVVSDTEITVTTPAHEVAVVDVVVLNTPANSTPGAFSYQEAPTVSGIAPDEGPLAGGTEVTITGTGFTGATGVTFDGEDGTSFTVVSDTEITVTTPAGVEGAAAVVVEHPAGDASAGDFTYVAAPTISAMDPDLGPIAGGTEVTITGTGFTDATGVTFDGDDGTSFTVVSDTEITVSSPAHAAGAVAVVVEHVGGDTAAGDFIYLANPSVTDLAPTSGPLAGGTEVTITGTGFTGATGVTFDGDAGTSFTVVSDTEITVTSPAHGAGAAAVIVEHPVVDAAAGDFTYTDGPAIASLTPDVGPVAGGTVVTIAGTGFTGATGVTFDGEDGTSFDVVSDTEITVSSPEHDAGAVNVVVAHPSGDSAPETFTYLATPAVTLVSPNAGPLEGGTEVTITGTGFTGATGVTFDGEDGTSFTVVSDTEITVTSPAHDAGIAEIVIQHPIADTVAGGFTYAASGIPIVNSMSPLRGPDTGGTLVTLRGSGFLGANGARFGALWGTNFTVLSDTMATVMTPEHEAMWVPAVLSSGAVMAATPGFTFEPTTLALADTDTDTDTDTATGDGLAYTGSSGFHGAWLALALIAAGALLLISRRPAGRHRA